MQLRVFRILPSLAVVLVRLKIKCANVPVSVSQTVEWATRVEPGLGYFMHGRPCGSRFKAEFSGCDFLIEEFKELKCNVESDYKILPLKGFIQGD